MPMAPTSDRSALVLFSGGQDSTVCLAWALERHARVETVGFDYGQRHGVEMIQRLKVLEGIAGVRPGWAERLGEDQVLDLRSFGAVAASALTDDRAIETTERGLPSTFVPGRNLAFFIYAAALADRRGADVLVGGMGEADFSGYPDCRRATMDAMEQALRLGMERPFAILTPLMHRSKAETWALAQEIGGNALVALTVNESHTCYNGVREVLHPWGYGCAECPACELRARGWDEWRASR